MLDADLKDLSTALYGRPPHECQRRCAFYFHFSSGPLVCVFLQEIDVALESAIRELSKFYSKNGPTASVPSETKDAIYAFLDQAEKLL